MNFIKYSGQDLNIDLDLLTKYYPTKHGHYYAITFEFSEIRENIIFEKTSFTVEKYWVFKTEEERDEALDFVESQSIISR